MSSVRPGGEEIRRFILKHVQDHPSSINRLATGHFGITRQAVNRHLRNLVADGTLRELGHTRAKTYELAPLAEWSRSYALDQRPAEDLVWRDDVAPALGPLPENVRDIWFYGFTEMFNNACDHSSGAAIHVSIRKTAVTTEMTIADDGVGIFRKIQHALGLHDERHAIFELSKGKLTTDPDRHTGEGIFFTSRVFDRFAILSGGVFFSHDFGEDDWILENENPGEGTLVVMRLSDHASRTLKDVFDQYTSGVEDPGFTKTVVPVYLAQYGSDKLISRSQAKRVMARVEAFKTVILNFRGVPSIGQAFTDEIFRIFVREHPQVDVVVAEANPDVTRMIARARANIV